MSATLKNSLSLIMMLCLGFILLRLPSEKVCFEVKDQHVCLRVLRDKADQARGFQFVENLRPNEGLLYILSGSKKPDFWMKDVIQPLDIVFIDIHGYIIETVQAYPLKKDIITPPQNTMYAIELMRGRAEIFKLIKGKAVSEQTLADFKEVLVLGY